MNKSEVVEGVAAAASITKKDAEAAVDAILDIITKTLKKGDKITFVGFGTFETRKRAARMARNPKTGEALKIKAKRVPAFKPGKALKDSIK